MTDIKDFINKYCGKCESYQCDPTDPTQRKDCPYWKAQPKTPEIPNTNINIYVDRLPRYCCECPFANIKQRNCLIKKGLEMPEIFFNSQIHDNCPLNLITIGYQP